MSSTACAVASGRTPRPRVRAARAGLALGLGAAAVALLLFLVSHRWGPLVGADQGVRDGLHRFALTHPVFVEVMRLLSDAGSAGSWELVVAAVTAGLLAWRLWRVALFAVVTTVGSALLNTGVKLLVNRERPVVDQPFVHEPGASFPSGHAQAAVAGYGVLLVVFVPVLSSLWRRVGVTLATAMALGIGFSRVALAAHFVSDVVAGFVLGATWVAAMTALFGGWRGCRGRPPVHPAGGSAPRGPVAAEADRLSAPPGAGSGRVAPSSRVRRGALAAGRRPGGSCAGPGVPR